MNLPVALLIGATFALPAFGSTMTVTFDETFIDTDGQTVLMESQGFAYQTSLLYADPDTLTLHDDFGITEAVIARLDGATFSPKKIDLIAFSNVFRTGPGPAPGPESDDFIDWTKSGIAPRPVLTFTGYLLSGDTVSLQVEGGYDYSVSEVLFGDAFANITALALSIALPRTLEQSGDGNVLHYLDESELDGTPDKDWCLNYCAEFVADNLVVEDPSGVPLPASGLLLGMAGLTLAGVRRARRG